MPPTSQDNDSWEYRGPRRDGVPPWLLVIFFGGGGMLLAAALVAYTAGLWIFADEDPPLPPSPVDPGSYVERSVRMQVVTRDFPDAVSGRVTLRVVVTLDNLGQRTVTSAEAVVSPTFEPGGPDVEPRRMEVIRPTLPLKPGEQQSFTVDFPGLSVEPSSKASVEVVLVDPLVGGL